MLEALLRVKFLLANREDKLGTTIAAGQRAVLQCHLNALSSTIWKRENAAAMVSGRKT